MIDNQKRRKDFTSFMEEVSSIADATSALHNSGETMFNIFVNNQNHDEVARAKIISYFGPISNKSFQKLKGLALALSVAKRKEIVAPTTHKSPLNSDIALPALCLFEFGESFVPNWSHGSVPCNAKEEKVSHDRVSALATRSGKHDEEVILSLLDMAQIYTVESNSSIDAERLVEETIHILTTQKSETDAQGCLFDLVGEQGINYMVAALENYDILKSINKSKVSELLHSPQASTTSLENLSANQKKKKHQKMNSNSKSVSSILNAGNASKSDNSEDIGSGSMSTDWLREVGFSEHYLEQERMLGLAGHKDIKSANVDSWFDNLASEGTLEYQEKRGLPLGTVRTTKPGYEEYFLPAHAKHQHGQSDLRHVCELEPWAQMAFEGTASFNPIQSKVFDIAYNTSENMLICAPTGAGKTNIAMLAFLNLVKQHIEGDSMNRNEIKAIYIAPMKALAQEVVSKFSERLKSNNLIVREFTGDMQLTRQEVATANFIVTTPEKWDVVTRKGGDGSLATMVSLIIIDEVHLLADDRGAVIESIVARTQRYIESSQKFVRIVGLSATLPNYKDVAMFLRVNPSIGLFHFGPEYRPVPLDQSFIGITEKNRVRRNDLMNQHAYEKTLNAIKNGKQVMIFVHSRKDTSKTLTSLLDIIAKNNTFEHFACTIDDRSTAFKRQVDKSRNQELQNFHGNGMGIHHAGMLRPDRTLTEQMFEAGVIKVLCCTATLAWGINLPAHTVIIKGTELYDPERGGFVNLSILDVFQIFGRAGRPQYDTCGHAIMITPYNTLHMYLGMLGSQAPIESNFIKALPDHLNAEIVNGTINNIKEANLWLSYTFLFVRMCKNPLAYGMKVEDVYDDPQLVQKRNELIVNAATILDQCMMIRYDRRSGNLAVTDIGRVASHYYIQHGSIESFNSMLTAHLTYNESLHVLCSSAEFDQLKIRPEEVPELEELKKRGTVKMKYGSEDTSGKICLLLNNYLENKRVNSFTLQSDTNYIASNAGRICRALFELCLKRGWSSMANTFLSLSKAIDRHMQIGQNPLRQFEELHLDIIHKLENARADPDKLVDLSPAEIGQLCNQQKHLGSKILGLVNKLPYLDIQTDIQTITRGVLKITLTVTPQFQWSEKYHGLVEPFWIWVEDGENEYIYHSEHFLLHKSQATESKVLDFTIPIREPLPPQYYVRVVSDRWVGCESVIPVSFQHLILPELHETYTDLLDVHPVSKKALGNSKFELLYDRFEYFNPIQSQAFHVLYHTDKNVLIGAPTGSGKTIIAELCMLRLFASNPKAKVVYIAPLKALARERMYDWQKKFGKLLGISVVELTGDITPDLAILESATVIIATPEKWDGITRSWETREYVRMVELIIIDEIHLLGVDRGPVLEVIVSRMRYISLQTNHPIRFVGLSTALANAKDLGDWLGIQDIGLYNFRPSVRPIPMSIYIQGFPGKHYCPRMATMNKPTYAAILEHSPTKPVLVFVSSRRQTRLTALDLISYCASDDDPKHFLHMGEDDIISVAQTLRDQALRDTIVFGIGIHHAGLDEHDRVTVENLFCEGKIQILVCTSTLAWGVNFPAHLVVIKGTEYFDGKTCKYVDFPVTDVLQMMGRAGRPQFDTTGTACIMVHEPKKNFYRKFLHEPFPVESSLHKCLHNHLNAEIVHSRVCNIVDCVDYLSWTYFFRRLVMNPSYYQLESSEPETVKKYVLHMMKVTLEDLQQAGCIIMDNDDLNMSVNPTMLGVITSYYYLDYRTTKGFQTRLRVMDTKRIRNASKKDDTELVAELALILCNAMEFSEVPVRHNEEYLNAELETKLPWVTDGYIMKEEHKKTYLILQAHFFHVPLPISDYINDSKSILDQTSRVINAFIDVSAADGYLKYTLHIMRLSQMIAQGLAENDSELLQLPHISPSHLPFFQKEKVLTIKNLLSLPLQKIESIAKSIFSKSNDQQCIKEFTTYAKSLPNVSMRFDVVQVDKDSSKLLASSSQDVPTWNLAPSEEYELKIYTELLRGNTQLSLYTPRYHKPRKLNWWIILGDATSDDLIAMKRVGSLGSSGVTTSLRFTALPQEDATRPIELQVLLISDSIHGLDVFKKFNYYCTQ